MTLETRQSSFRMANNPSYSGGDSSVHAAFRFDVQQITEANRFDVMARVQPFHDRLKLAHGRTLEELHRNVSVGAEAVFVQKLDSDEDIAVVVQRLKEINLGGEKHRVLKRLLRAVAPDNQQAGIGTALTNEAIERLMPEAITGRTPNPLVFGADEHSPYIRTIFAIHRLYTHYPQTLLIATLDENSLAETNLRTGVCKGAYPPGQFRLFSLEGLSPRNMAIYHRMTDPEPYGLGADLEAGDAIRYMEMVSPPRGSARLSAVQSSQRLVD